MKELNGRLAFVTAGANGIGLALAKAFGAEGMNVAIGDVDEEALEKAIAELRAVTQAEPFLFNVADRAAFAQAADAAEARFGPVGVLCNNAAAELPMTPATMTYEGWDRSLSVTLGGAVNGTQTFLPRMVSRPRGGPYREYGLPGRFGGGSRGAELHLQHVEVRRGRAVRGVAHVARRHERGGHGDLPGLYGDERREPGTCRAAEEGLVPRARGGRAGPAGGDARSAGNARTTPGGAGREGRAGREEQRHVRHGARRVDQVQERMDALIAAMPEETERDRALEEFLRH